MTEPDFSHLDEQHALGENPIPQVVVTLAGDRPVDLVWRNELGGLTFRIDDQFVKWNPPQTGVDLERERVRLEWLSGRHPGPRVIASGSDDGAQWLLTAALPGETAVGDTWRSRRSEAIRAIATGLRAIHAIPIDEFPLSLDWNFGEGHQAEFFEAYGITPDEERIRYYRALWHLES